VIAFKSNRFDSLPELSSEQAFDFILEWIHRFQLSFYLNLDPVQLSNQIFGQILNFLVKMEQNFPLSRFYDIIQLKKAVGQMLIDVFEYLAKLLSLPGNAFPAFFILRADG